MNAKSAQLSELTTKSLGDGSSRELLENSEIYHTFSTFNDKLYELAEINKALQVTQTGTLHANNLLDQRDMLLNDIAQYVDINVEEHPINGSVTLYIAGEEMVKGAKVVGEFELRTAQEFVALPGDNYNTYPDDWIITDENGIPIKDDFGQNIPREAAVISIVRKTDNGIETILADANSVLTTGSIGGLLHSGDVQSDQMTAGVAQKALDSIALAIAQEFNKLNTDSKAYCINPANTGELKATTEQNFIFGEAVAIVDPITNQITGYELAPLTAANISVNSNLLKEGGEWNIACAYFEDMNNFNINAVGNSQNVVAMLGTRNEKINGLSNLSIEDYYTNLLGKIASGGSNGEALVETQQNVVDAIQDKIHSNNSVDINEELVDLVKYQTAYTAAAQVFNTCNSCLNTLMALGG